MYLCNYFWEFNIFSLTHKINSAASQNWIGGGKQAWYFLSVKLFSCNEPLSHIHGARAGERQSWEGANPETAWMEQWLKLNIQITIREKFKLHEESSSINVTGSCLLVLHLETLPFSSYFEKDGGIMLQERLILIWQVRKWTWNRPFYEWMRNHLFL